jgi:hypothetical protein
MEETVIEEMVEGQLKYIRKMALLTDDQIRTVIRHKIAERPDMISHYQDTSQKKLLDDIMKMSKDIKSDARVFARKVDKL